MKTIETITIKIFQITSDKFGVNVNKLTTNTSFTDDLGVDSLDVYELLMSVEKEFRISINDEDSGKLITIGKLIDYVADKTGAQLTVVDNKIKEEISAQNLTKATQYN